MTSLFTFGLQILIVGSIPMRVRSSYPPPESPPPYPGEYEGSLEEKVPLSETQFVNGDLHDSPQRFQMSPLLSSPGGQSPTTCQVVLPNRNDDDHQVPWSCNRNTSIDSPQSSYANQTQFNQRTIPGNIGISPMQEISMHKVPNAPSVNTNPEQKPTAMYEYDGNFAPGKQSSSVGLSSPMSDSNIRQNCSNEQRQLYNMVIVGVEPDLTVSPSQM